MQSCRKHTGGLQDPRKNHEKWSSASQKKVNTYMELSTQDRCIHLANGGTLRWHTPLSRPFNRGRLCKNEGSTMQNCRKRTGGLQDPRKKPWKMKQRKPKVKVNIYMELSTQDRCIHLANGGTLRWHTPLSRPFNRGRLCKTHWKTPGPTKKTWKMKQRKAKVKVNIYMELSTQDRCIHLANGGTLRWHTPLSRPFNRGRLCKNEGRTMQNCRKRTGRLQDPRKKHEKWSSASQKWRSTYTWSFPHKTGAYILQMGAH